MIYRRVNEQIVLAPRPSQLDESQVSVQEPLLEIKKTCSKQGTELDLTWNQRNAHFSP